MSLAPSGSAPRPIARTRTPDRRTLPDRGDRDNPRAGGNSGSRGGRRKEDAIRAILVLPVFSVLPVFAGLPLLPILPRLPILLLWLVLVPITMLASPTLAQAAGSPPAADLPTQPDSAQIRLGLRKLGVVGNVLYIAAHPDDENNNLLAYLSNEKLLRTAYLSLTRGDGGQNLIGAEQGTDLGVIRTQELLAARRIDGAEQLFTRARDFGYSKHAEETLRIWDRDAVLADVVHAIRTFRPDVIITRFSPEQTDTHGHHTASAQLALAAFHAAADASFHPEQLGQGTKPWQARRIYWNRSAWGIKPGEDMGDWSKLEVDRFNPLLGLSYGEMAARSRSMHKSQGFGAAWSRGPVVEYFRLLAAQTVTPSGASGTAGPSGPLDGLDLTWHRLPGTARLQRLIERAERTFDATAPHRTIPLLVQIDRALAGVPDPWREQKQAEVRNLILACAGLFAEATTSEPSVTPGAELDLTVTALNRSPAAMRLREVRLVGATLTDGTSTLTVAQPLGSLQVKHRIRTLADLPFTTPYWLALPPRPGLFQVADLQSVNEATAAPPLRVELVLEVDGLVLERRLPLVQRWTDPVAGERLRAVEVVPALTVTPETATLLLPNHAPRSLRVQVAGQGAASGSVTVTGPAGWSITPARQPFSLAGPASEVALSFRVAPPPTASAEAVLQVMAQFDGDGGKRRYAAFVAHLEHDHIPRQTVLHSSEVRAVAFPFERHLTTLGYLPGPGDEVAASLRQMGYDVRVITPEGFTPGALHDLPAIVTGVRAFNADERARAALPALLAYVEQGGTLVVQYNTNNRLAPLALTLGPYPFTIGSERVTDENAAVQLSLPAHPLLTWPNPIDARDFAGWVQERGLYFARNWDGHYQTLLSMSDPGEAPLAGGILFTRYGKGAFIYTGLAFFRQLPAGVPGAFRLLANLLAAGQEPQGLAGSVPPTVEQHAP